MRGVVRRPARCACWLVFILALGCGKRQASDEPQALSSARAAGVDEGVRAFTRTVAQDVTRDGPVAWRKHFGDGPEFYMASEGQLVFPNGAAATAAIADLAKTLKHIELKWGDDIRVDPLTANLAGVAVSYSEILVNAAGERRAEKGFLTGTAEYKDGRWRFRNAHWSVVPPPLATH